MSTKIKLLHENTEYRQDHLSVYDITPKIMPRIMQVPWFTMDKGKSQNDRENSEIRIFLRRLFLEAQQASRNAHKSQ